MTEASPKLKTVLARGARRRCPRCGKGPIYKRWLTMHESCSACGIKYLENQGDLWGVLLALDRALFILPVIVMIYFRLYNPGSIWFIVFIATVFFGFIFTTPHRNGMGLGVDYYIRCKFGDLSPEAKPPEADR